MKTVASTKRLSHFPSTMGAAENLSENTSAKPRSISSAEDQLVREAFERDGLEFKFLSVIDSGLGYYVEPWTNDCLTGPKLSPDQPAPVSLDRSDEEITEDESAIRHWIGAVAHAIVVQDIARHTPDGWTPLAHDYFDDWSEIEFGASVVLFRTTPAIESQSADTT